MELLPQSVGFTIGIIDFYFDLSVIMINKVGSVNFKTVVMIGFFFLAVFIIGSKLSDKIGIVNSCFFLKLAIVIIFLINTMFYTVGILETIMQIAIRPVSGYHSV